MITARREKQVLMLLEAGCSDAEVADELDIGVHTAKRYRCWINVRRRAAGLSVFMLKIGRPAKSSRSDERGEWAEREVLPKPCPRNWPADPEKYRVGVA